MAAWLQMRWTEAAAALAATHHNLVGDMLVAAGVIAYLGVFTLSLREETVARWAAACAACGVPSSPRFRLVDALGDPVKVRSSV